MSNIIQPVSIKDCPAARKAGAVQIIAGAASLGCLGYGIYKCFKGDWGVGLGVGLGGPVALSLASGVYTRAKLPEILKESGWTEEQMKALGL